MCHIVIALQRCMAIISLVDTGKAQLADSTSDGMRKIKEEQLLNVAEIVPKLAVEWYGLRLHAGNVGDNPNTKTMFAVLKKY